MIVLLFWLLLRPLLEKPLRLIAWLFAGLVLAAVPDLLLRRYLDADLPRAATAVLLVVLAAAALFLRASWRRRWPSALTRPEDWGATPPQSAPPPPAAPGKRCFALRIAVLRGPNGSTRTVVVLDRQRRP
jgi:uncharacterized membrane protein YfcA